MRFVAASFVRCRAVPAILLAMPLLWCGCDSSEAKKNDSSKFRVATGEAKAEKTATPDPSIPQEESVPSSTTTEVGGAVPSPPNAITAAGEERAPQPEGAPGAGSSPLDKLDPELRKKLLMLKRLSEAEAQGKTQQQRLQSFQRINKERLRLTDEIIAEPTVPEMIRNDALRERVEALSALVYAETPGAEEELKKTAEILLQLKDEEYVLLGRLTFFQLALRHISSLNPPTGEPYVKEIEKLFSESKNHPAVAAVGINGARIIQSLGHIDDAADALMLVADTYSGNEEKRVAAIADDARLQALALRATQGKEAGREAAKTELLAAVDKFTAPGGSAEAAFSSLRERVMDIEPYDVKVASEIYERMNAAYGKHPNPKLAEAAGQVVENGLRRIGLLGKPLDVTGTLLDGEAFDGKALKGKVVLVDFWATWCGPCIQEMSNIRAAYDKYHDQGFEVIGYNLDEEPGDLDGFMKQAALPWPIVVSEDAKQIGFASPLAAHCGVDSIPFVILIGRDGNVDGIHVRGPRLEARLAEIFGNSGKPSAEEKPEETTDKAKSGEPNLDELKPPENAKPKSE